ncbi:MAG: hypothetical protein EXQ63_02425 [Ilumatobacteraceae bacterium]|nr:hypothetical protein [Ilumatobacteraceae bacterium]
MTMPRILAIMGSGETAPTMVTTHRRLTSLLASSVRAVVLDTPYGFQENAPELAMRAVEYFKTSINVDLTVAGLVRLKNTHIKADPVEVEHGLRNLTDANYVFAGPGSPTYALRQWNGTPVAGILAEKLRTGGIIVFASAAALTLGKATVPVYEIYKVGEDVRCLDGLDLLSIIGINAAVIPHYDNAEGANHDTRFCYLGQTRLEMFESMLDDDTFVLGVDEHTGLIIDLDTQVATIVGNGTVTVRLRAQSQVFAVGDTLSLAYLQNPWAATAVTAVTPMIVDTAPTEHDDTAAPALSLAADTKTAVADFDIAIQNADAHAAVRAVLFLEAAIRSWSSDTLQGDSADHAHAALRSMISQLGEAATSGLQNPKDVIAPYVDALIAVRTIVRAEKRFDLSDIIRDIFAARGIEVRDTPDGVQWDLHVV